MDSPDSFQATVAVARMNAAKRNAEEWQNAYEMAKEHGKLSSDRTWYWGAAFEAMHQVFMEIARRNPLDPLFKPTGKKLPDGSLELEYHRQFERFLANAVEKMPREVSRGQPLLEFKRNRKI